MSGGGPCKKSFAVYPGFVLRASKRLPTKSLRIPTNKHTIIGGVGLDLTVLRAENDTAGF